MHQKSFPLLLGLFVSFAATVASFSGQANELPTLQKVEQLLSQTCYDCHQGDNPAGQFSIENFTLSMQALENESFDTVPWERILKRIRAGQMPPPDHASVDRGLVAQAQKDLESLLDWRESQHPFIPANNSLRRLTQTEYRNAVRDLVGMVIDVETLLPKDESSHGFDNITVTELSPTYIHRAVQAAQLISRQVFGTPTIGPAGITHRVPPERSQESHVEGLPLGTRGGTVFEYHFPQSGRYEFQVRLTRDRDEHVEGIGKTSPIDILLNRKRIHRFDAPKPIRPNDHTLIDAHLNVQLDVVAGTQKVGVTFPQHDASLIEIKRQPFDAAYNQHRHPRIHPAIYEVSIIGPLDSDTNIIPETDNTKKLFGSLPINPPTAEQERVAEQVLSRIARRAFRRPLLPQDLANLKKFFDAGKTKSFASGMELALASILVNPNFLLRVEPIVEEPQRSTSVGDQPKFRDINALELASRLSFFLWSSLPDDELLDLAQQGSLSEPDVLDRQVERMLADPRSDAMVTNFASQWLYLRNLAGLTPDLRLYPDFDDNLRLAMRSETESLFREIIREDLSVLKLLKSDHTYMNERLAVHYGQSGVLGSEMRRVNLMEDSPRGGILRHASILSVTSYATRTSPTIRGNWILENLIGTPPPPPPPNVPTLKEKQDSAPQTTRERLALHRENPSCASCHNLMDPLGFAMENYDALGRWREWDGDAKIDTEGVLPDGMLAKSVNDIELSLLKRPELFAGTMVEKLTTFALGRGMEPQDGPQLRRIVSQAAQSDYQFSSMIKAIARSPLFRKRRFEPQ